VNARTDVLRPDWPVSSSVHAATTLRTGGVSAAPYESLNLGTHVGDDPAAVADLVVRSTTRLVRA